jgi:5-methylcytosine-specific restriction endonuclease McrA
MSDKRRRLVLGIVATDRTFARELVRGQRVWVGKCIHCSAKLVVDERGELGGVATVEHIVPRHHGGDDAIANHALACAGCNHEKGVRHDARRRDDPKLRAMIERLQARRRERWRDPDPET